MIRRALEFESTGDPALDRILGGGIPKRSTVVLAGEPGAGKTVLTLQMLFNAARHGRRCLYFTTLSEPAIKVMQYMQLFGFFDPEQLERNVVFADLGAAVRQGPEATLSEIGRRVEKLQPELVAIDSFRAIGELMGQSEQRVRPFVYDLAVQLASWGATTLLVGEYVGEEVSTLSEFAVADGIIRLSSERDELTTMRELEVLKLRGAGYVSGRHFFEITQAGAGFYPRVSAPLDEPVARPRPTSPQRVRLGVEGLDELLCGGVLEGSTTMVQGGAGTGKTLLGLQFLIEGARQGQKGVLFTLEEAPEQLRDLAATLGWDLRGLEEQGMVTVRYTSPVELSTDRFLHQARNQIAQTAAERAVFDSLTTMALGVRSERRFKEMVYAIAKHLRGAQVTSLMTVECEQLLGAAQLSGQGISFVADNLVQLRYVELGGRLERAISVLKARGIKHDTELRSLSIDRGVHVLKGRFRDMRGVLTGLPSRDERVP